MCPHMNLKSSSSRISIVALRTFIRQLPCVDQHMRFQVTFCYKRLITVIEIALKWSFPSLKIQYFFLHVFACVFSNFLPLKIPLNNKRKGKKTDSTGCNPLILQVCCEHLLCWLGLTVLFSLELISSMASIKIHLRHKQESINFRS